MKTDFISEYLYPARIMAVSGNVENAEALLLSRTPQAGLAADNLTVVKGKAKIVLDYGKEIHGGLKIVTHVVKDADILIRFGESVNEAVAPAGFKNSGNDHSPREFKVVLQSYSQTEYGNTGFRFACIEFGENAEAELKTAPAVFRYRNLVQRGKFECSDALVNKIYDTAAYTCKLCMQEMLWDGIKRDRLVWVGDMHPETLSINCLFGGDGTVKDALDFSAAEYPLPGYMNFMPSYSMWYALILKDYFMQTGDKDYLEKNGDYLAGVMEMFAGKFTESGNLNLEGYFLDWPSSDMEDAVTGVKALLLMAAKAGEYMLGILNRDTAAAQSIAAKLQKTDFCVSRFKQAAAIKYLSGAQSGYNPAEFLTEGGAKGLSTFTAYYVLKSAAETAGTDSALKMMKDFYGAMLSRGATTFWEEFNIDWLDGSGRIDEFTPAGLKDLHGDYGDYCYEGFRHSLCHGWSSGAVPFLTEKVLGVKILEPGCRKLEIRGDLCGLEYARGVYPTPLGDVEIMHEKRGDKIRTDVKAPDGIQIITLSAK